MDELFLNTSLDTLVETNAVEIRKFSSLMNSSRGVSLVITCIREEDEEEEEEEEEEEKLPVKEIAQVITNAQKAGEYATIDTDSDEEEYDVEEIEISGVKYYTTDLKNGVIFEFLENEDIGEELGKLQNGVLFLS